MKLNMKLVGVREVAAILNWEPAKVSTYYRRGKLPKPIEVLASGPVWYAFQIEGYMEGENMEKSRVLVDLLSHEMINIFGGWVGTPSEELLEDDGTVIDWIRNDSEALQGVDLSDIPQEYWDAAWDIFDKATGRG